MKRLVGAVAAAMALAWAGSTSAAIVIEGVETGDYFHQDIYLSSPLEELPRLRFTFDADLSKFSDLYVSVHIWSYFAVIVSADGEIHYGNYDGNQTAPIRLTPTGFTFDYDANENPQCTPTLSDPWCYHDFLLGFAIQGPITAPLPYRLTISAVPEPATWAMMIIGFGAVGAMLRYPRTARSVRGLALRPFRRS